MIGSAHQKSGLITLKLSLYEMGLRCMQPKDNRLPIPVNSDCRVTFSVVEL